MKSDSCVAIIVVTYNRSDVTCLMLESLVLAKNQAQYELILIDNQSRPEELAAIKESYQKLTKSGQLKGHFIESGENKGFSGGNNIGIKMAFDSDKYTHICLLNNDTIVTDYWLDHLISHDVKGLIGPVSNSVGNEQIIPLMYEIKGVTRDTLQQVFQFADSWRETHKGNIESTPMLGFFCVLGPISVFRKIGLLDEAFGVGMYEDDDYCVRARQLGFDIKIARDVFVHHWGSASFSRLKRESLMNLMAKNREYYERKHNIIWPTYSTTLVDALCFEAEWMATHPSPLADRAYQGYQNLLKSFLKSIYLQVEEVQGARFLGLLAWGLRHNYRMNRYVRGSLLLIVHLLRGCFGERQGFVEMRALISRARLHWRNV